MLNDQTIFFSTERKNLLLFVSKHKMASKQTHTAFTQYPVKLLFDIGCSTSQNNKVSKYRMSQFPSPMFDYEFNFNLT